ncbi:atherin-like isoform X2 [Camelus ferus]|nr:atherin-like isoform X2 [Camelus ferus]
MLGNLRAPSGTRTRKYWLPTPNPAGSPQSLPLAIAAASARKGAAKRVPVGGGEESPFPARPLSPGSDPRLPRTRPGLSLALPFDPHLVEPCDPQLPPSPALALPRARGQSSGHPDRSPPPDPGPPARSRACPRQAHGPVPRHPDWVLETLSFRICKVG